MLLRTTFGFALTLVLAFVWGAAAPVTGAQPPSPLVRVELISETASIRPGETLWVAIRQEITPGWHTYWGVNPGDAGEPTRIEWTLPTGVTAGAIAWPYPSRFPVGIAMSYGYENAVVLPIPMTVSGAAAPGTTLALRGQVSWLVCAKICIPEEAPVALSIPVAVGAPRPDPRRFADRGRPAEPARSELVAGFVRGDAGDGHPERDDA